MSDDVRLGHYPLRDTLIRCAFSGELPMKYLFLRAR